MLCVIKAGLLLAYTSLILEPRLKVLISSFQKLSYLQVAIFTSMHNIGYFSNFFYCAFGRPYAQVVTPDKNVTISAMVDAGQPWRTTIGDNLVYTGRTVNDLFLSKLPAGRANCHSTCIFCVFRLFLSLCQTASQPYKLSHTNALRVNQFY